MTTLQLLGIAAIIFMSGYLVNIFYVTVLYHRGLAHSGVKLHPRTLKFVQYTGNWLTGIDPVAWVAMHRLHHQYSDSHKDPHSPIRQGIFGVALGQLKSYELVLKKLIKRDPKYTRIVADIPFTVSRLNRKKIWILPYLMHIVISIAISLITGVWFFGLAYYIGIMSHPVQGWMVNSLAHRFGYRNFSTRDHSRNNLLVSLLVFGEGFQNNHHAKPNRAKFAARFWEVDFGYVLCWFGERLRILKINRVAV